MPTTQHTDPRLTRRGLIAAAAAGAGAIGLAACASDSTPGGSGSSSGANATSTASPSITITSAHGTDAVLPDDSLTINATNGTVVSVKATGPDGAVYTGQLNDTTWKPDRTFWPESEYTVSVDVMNLRNEETTLTEKITTASVNTLVYEPVYTGDGLGVAMPVYVQFSDTIDDAAHRAAIEKQASVTTSPEQTGSWGWVEDRILMWRPKDYWTPGTTVNVKLAFAGVKVGDQQYLADDTEYTMTIAGQKVEMVCDLGTQHMDVYQDGTLLRTCPVSTGKVGHETYSGTKVIMQKYDTFTMDSSTYGVPSDSADGYKTEVPNCQRITWSGEFLHSASWSVGSQGVTPTSHGCTNLSPDDAAWLMTVSHIGDPVVFNGTTPGGTYLAFEPSDGIGCWAYDWNGWKKQSAQS